MADQRKAALDVAIRKIEKNFGKGSIMRMGDATDMKVASVSSGSLAIDKALGIGGYPRGRIVEIYGPESSGKTTVALHAVAEVQRQGGTAAYIDAENALDPQYAEALGVNIDDLLLSQPDSGEEGLEIADALISSGAVDLVIVDSVAALVPRAEIDGDMGDTHVGLQARLMSQALRKLSGEINKTKTIAIFINQIREKVGVMFGNPETTTGGRALKFYSTIRMEIRRAEQIKNGTDVIGNKAKVKIVKNKVAPPFKRCEVDIMYGEGISKTGELLDMAVENDLVDKSGAWYSYGNERIGQGRENAKKWLKEHPDSMNELMDKVRVANGDVATPQASAQPNKKAKNNKGERPERKGNEAPKQANAKLPATIAHQPASKKLPMEIKATAQNQPSGKTENNGNRHGNNRNRNNRRPKGKENAGEGGGTPQQPQM